MSEQVGERAAEAAFNWSSEAPLEAIIRDLDIEVLRAPSGAWPLVSAVTLDLEEVSAGALFIARKLWYINTHAQVIEAARRGAAAVLVSERHAEVETLLHSEDEALSALPILFTPHEDPTLGLLCDRYYGHPTSTLKVYGVTGTNGKTSAVSYLAELLRSAGERVAVIGTVAYSCEERVLPAPNTTPDALVIHRLARQALTLGATALALEVSSHALTLYRVAGVAFDAVGFTSWGRDHLDFHGTLEAYREAKGMLFDHYLVKALERGERPIAVAHDDEPGRDMLRRAPLEVRRILCRVRLTEPTSSALQASLPSIPKASELVGDASREETLSLQIVGQPSARGVTLRGARVSAERRDELSALELPLIGDYHPSNLAIALGMVSGTHPKLLQRCWSSLTQTRGVPGRMERVTLPCEVERAASGRVALVDYAHTPDAITRALQALRAVHQGPLHVVIGCGGDRDRGKRPEMTRAALRGADVVWLTSDNPRSELPEQIIEDALSLSSSERAERDQVRCEVSRRACLESAWSALPPLGALLITGKGHEDYQEVGERRYRLHDVEALRAAAWSQHHRSALIDVPYVSSIFDQLGSLGDAAPKTLKRRALEVCREALGRRGGLGLCIVSQAQAIELKSQLRDEWRTKLLWVERAPTDELLARALCEGLTPRVKWVVWIAEREAERAALQDQAQRLNALIEETPPHLNLRLCFDPDGLSNILCEAPQIGGWPKLQRGAKIPSFL